MVRDAEMEDDMGWRSKVQAPNTISDEKWRGIQSRAAKANPRRDQIGTPEQMKAGRDGQANYRNRNNC